MFAKLLSKILLKCSTIPLIWAAEKGCTETVRLLLDEGIDPTIGNNSAIRLAAQNGKSEVVKLLLQDKRVDPSADNNNAICWAYTKRDIKMAEILLQDRRLDPAVENNYAIRWASEYGYLEVVKLLLQDPRVDPATDNNYAIRWASYNGHTEVVKLLIADKRVDWRYINNRAMKNGLIKEEKNKLKEELTMIYLAIRKTTSVTSYGPLQKDIIKRIAHLSIFYDLYDIDKRITIRTLVFANLLGIEYHENYNKDELYDKIKELLIL